MVVGCLAATGAVVVGNAIVEGDPPSFRQIVGFTFTATGLATAALVAPELAASFSVLILTSAVFVYGTPLWDALSSPATGTDQSSTRTPAGPPATAQV